VISFHLHRSKLIYKLIIESSFKLTFWIWIDIESSCSHFQLDSSRVAHIFNSTWLNSTENWVNSTRFVKNLSLTSRELNIEIFPVFCFCITFLHYLFDRESWRETWRLYDRKSWREAMVESHGREPWRGNMEAVWWKVIKGNHEGKPWRETWRLYDRKSWRGAMVGSHGREPCRGNMKAVWLW